MYMCFQLVSFLWMPVSTCSSWIYQLGYLTHFSNYILFNSNHLLTFKIPSTLNSMLCKRNFKILASSHISTVPTCYIRPQCKLYFSHQFFYREIQCAAISCPYSPSKFKDDQHEYIHIPTAKIYLLRCKSYHTTLLNYVYIMLLNYRYIFKYAYVFLKRVTYLSN